ncbi:hypothetical protein V6N13_107587 [Hibiscus sabdariffa]|uniref:Uncharacterized protein n=1 Tax=Hibiscus sabdariffa TaxID=183260 RepID=A0ABR2SQH0_9ROSI
MDTNAISGNPIVGQLLVHPGRSPDATRGEHHGNGHVSDMSSDQMDMDLNTETVGKSRQTTEAIAVNSHAPTEVQIQRGLQKIAPRSVIWL